MFDGIKPLNAANQPTFARARAFVELCSALSNGEGVLRAAGLDLSRFAKLAPYMCIMGVIDGGSDFELRLAGTRLVDDFLGYDPTGKRFSQVLKDDEFGQRGWYIAREVVRTRRPVLNQPGCTRLKSKEFMLLETVHFPVVDQSGTIVKIVGLYDFQFQKAAAVV